MIDVEIRNIFRRISCMTVVIVLSFLLLIAISHAQVQMNISRDILNNTTSRINITPLINICKSTGGEWIVEEICPPPLEVRGSCFSSGRCICPEGYFDYCASHGCMKDLEYGEQPTSKENCENGEGQWVEFPEGMVCACPSGKYWSSELKCINKPEVFLCESTCGVYEDGSCECEPDYVWEDGHGCISIRTKEKLEITEAQENETVGEKICGNDKCEIGETQENCCLDCGCPPDYGCVDNDCKVKVIPIDLIYLIIIVIVVVVLTVYFLMRKSKKTKLEPPFIYQNFKLELL